jgi:pyruvate dehydrogenase E2 component (dihydrolipoyllysine-residue acetyltransferase)
MATPITVPRLGWSMEEGTFVEWLKRDGDLVESGEPLFVLESDKATETIEALDGGILRLTKETPASGTVVKVGQVVGYLAAEGEEIRSQESGVRRQESEVRSQAPSPRMSAAIPGVVKQEAPSRTRPVSPRARRAARERGIDPAALPGTGRGGRVRERDILAAAAATHAAGHLIPHTHLRRTIAARMVAGVTQTAPVTLHTKADATHLVLARRSHSVDNAPSYTDLLLKITATALQEHPLLRAQWRDDGLFLPDAIDIAFAVDTEAGLLAPVIRHVAVLAIDEIAKLTRDLSARARSGSLTAEEMRSATFTITNLGMFGIDAFTPIIPLPQCAILGVGRIVREPAVVDDKIVPRDLVTLSLTFDHRVLDGAPAARFLETVRRLIEQKND